jgi:hypothetical protein
VCREDEDQEKVNAFPAENKVSFFPAFPLIIVSPLGACLPADPDMIEHDVVYGSEISPGTGVRNIRALSGVWNLPVFQKARGKIFVSVYRQ